MPQAHILVADDDETTREMLEAALSGRYTVTTAADGRSALEHAAKGRFDLVLLDVEMPGLDGHATCQALKARPQTSDLPVIFLSARVTLDERLRGYQVGANDYLTKPFDVSELVTKIELAVSQRARNRTLASEIEEAQNSVLAAANLYGEMGVVFEMQRQLSSCKTYGDIGRAFFDALSKLGLEGCLRLSGRQGVVSLTASAECSALENSILDHIEAKSRQTIEALGEHTCIRHSNTLMLIRQLPMHPDPQLYSGDDIDRIGRLRDNTALMAEGIVTYLHALDATHSQQDLSRTKEIIQLTRETLSDLAAQQHATRMQLAQILRAMTTEVEHSFIHLGLSATQEDQLTNTLHKHVAEVMVVVSQVDEIEMHLEQLVRKIEG
jgi:CheY-like chemotaxis protein